MTFLGLDALHFKRQPTSHLERSNKGCIATHALSDGLCLRSI